MTVAPAATGSAEDPSRAVQAWSARSLPELLSDQLFGIDEWHRLYGSRAEAREIATKAREARLDLHRRSQARRAEQEALLERARDALDRSLDVLTARPAPRAVLAHRNAWFAGKVAERLTERGVDVVLVTADGAQAIGAAVVEQPEILLVEDRLPTLSGLQVLERVCRCCRRTLTAAQLLDATDLDRFREGGARALFTRRVPPLEVADTVLDCLLADAGPVSVL